MIETILADMILSVFSGIYYHILCAEHGRQGKKLAACVLSFIALNLVIDVLFLTPTAANNLITFILTSAFILFFQTFYLSCQIACCSFSACFISDYIFFLFLYYIVFLNSLLIFLVNINRL